MLSLSKHTNSQRMEEEHDLPCIERGGNESTRHTKDTRTQSYHGGPFNVLPCDWFPNSVVITGYNFVFSNKQTNDRIHEGNGRSIPPYPKLMESSL
jgi:hypothetical protein